VAQKQESSEGDNETPEEIVEAKKVLVPVKRRKEPSSAIPVKPRGRHDRSVIRAAGTDSAQQGAYWQCSLCQSWLPNECVTCEDCHRDEGSDRLQVHDNGMGLTDDEVQQFRDSTVIRQAFVHLAGFCNMSLGAFMYALARLKNEWT